MKPLFFEQEENFGATPLHYAVSTMNYELVEFYLSLIDFNYTLLDNSNRLPQEWIPNIDEVDDSDSKSKVR